MCRKGSISSAPSQVKRALVLVKLCFLLSWLVLAGDLIFLRRKKGCLCCPFIKLFFFLRSTKKQFLFPMRNNSNCKHRWRTEKLYLKGECLLNYFRWELWPQKCQGLWSVLHNYGARFVFEDAGFHVLAAKVVKCVPCCQQRMKKWNKEKQKTLIAIVTEAPNIGQLFDIELKYHILQQRASSITYGDGSVLLQTCILVMATHRHLLI